MAGGGIFSSNSLRPEAPDQPEQLGPRAVDEEIGPNDSNIHIDARTGHFRTENPDGSVSVRPIEQIKKRAKRGAASFNDNLAEELDATTLAMISMRLLEGIEADIQSRQEWEQTAQKGAALLGVKLEEASSQIGLDGTIARVKHTGLLQACLNSWGSSRAELLPVGGPVKVRDDSQTEDEEIIESAGGGGIGHNGGPPLDDMTNVVPGPGAPPHIATPPGPTGGGINAAQAPKPPAPPPPIPPPSTNEKRNALADALEHDMNHYLTVIDKDYYPNTSQMLMSRGLLGCQFKKVYHDPLLRRPVSRWVKGTDLIVSNEATSLSGAARITERIPMRQSVVKRLQVMHHWADVSLVIPTSVATAMERQVGDVQGVDPMPRLPADQLHTIYECYCELDIGALANDERGKDVGYPLPYRVTLDKDSRQILEIRRNWKKGDETYTARRRYVKFGHVPGLGFYDWGFVHLIGNPQRAATMIERVLIDTGMLNSFPGGIVAKTPGSRQRTTEIRPAPGEFAVMDTGGLPMSDFITVWPYKEPSAVLAAMGQDIASQMKQVSGTVDLPVGEGRIGNTPVGTIMAYIDAVSKVPSAVHKDDHIAQQEEFEMLKELFAEAPETLWRGAKKPMRKWAVAQEIMDQDLVPAADPNVPSQTHRLMQTNLRMQAAGLPQFQGIANQRAIWEDFIRTTGGSNTGEYTLPPAPPQAPPPDPKIVVAQIKSADAAKELQAKQGQEVQEHQAKMEELAVTSADKAADRDSENLRAALKHKTESGAQHTDLVKHGITTAATHKQHTDNLGVQGAQLAQDHVQHLDNLDQAEQDRTAQTLQSAQPDDTAPPTGGP